MSAIRIFIGTDDTQVVPTAVLKHSILSRTRAEVEFRDLRNLETGLENLFYTGFSFYRWGIPSFCNFEGRAIYLDADIVVLCDIRELWDLNVAGHSHLARPRPRFRVRQLRLQRLGGAYASVMLIDCAHARNWNFRAWCERAADDRDFYKQVMWCLPGSPTASGRGDLPKEYNDLDRHEPGRTKVIHYTALPDQPWKRTGHTHEQVFRRSLRETYQAGAVDLDTVKAEIGRGHIHSQTVDWCTGPAQD